jgi:hypothetical protein
MEKLAYTPPLRSLQGDIGDQTLFTAILSHLDMDSVGVDGHIAGDDGNQLVFEGCQRSRGQIRAVVN